MSKSVPFREAMRVWAKIGLLSFGGPAGQVALMHRELVERRRWIDEARFLHALNYCMLLPGPEAQQLATYIGWLMHRTRGGLVAGTLFIVPGFVAILILSTLYAMFRELTLVSSAFSGLKAAVLAVVIEALLRVAKRALKSRLAYLVCALSFVAIFLLEVPFPWIVLGAGSVGALAQRLWPSAFSAPVALLRGEDAESVFAGMERRGELEHTRPDRSRSVRVLALCLGLWWAPIALLFLVHGEGSIYVQQGLFFSQTAVVTFGGAYAVLAYIAQRSVETYHWLLPGEMVDGLGLAETTPGPLIMVVQFVAFIAAYRHPGALSPWMAGVCGSLITVWVTFVPCFLWIFLGAPYIEALRGNRQLSAALSVITAGVVGVILNLSLWFALHVFFRELSELRFGPVRLLVPAFRSLEPRALLLSALSLVLVFRLKWSLPKTLALSSGAGILLSWPVW